MSNSQIKGLAQFIADLRGLTGHEAERVRVQTELASLRRKMPSKPKASYETKKAVAKILYVYILGYPVDMGIQESLALIRSTRYSEKQIGYLALELMFSDNGTVVEEAMNMVIEDLRSPKELHTSLALNFVAVLRRAPQTLVDEVFKLLVSPTSAPSVSRKAALTIKEFYHQSPLFMEQDWADRVVVLLDSPQLGLAHSATELIIEIARNEREKVRDAFPRALRRLSTVWAGEGVPLDYIYYRFTAPWFLVKLLELVGLWSPLPTSESSEWRALKEVLLRVISFCGDDADDKSAAPQQMNVRNAVLYEAVRTAAHIGIDIRDAVGESLNHLLQAREPNHRYLGLRLMSIYPGLAGNDEVLTLALSLSKDRDHSVRHEALDALSSIANSVNVERMTSELLDTLVTSDVSIRAQMVTRLAGIIERFATSPSWYVETCLSLLSIGGSYVGDEVWERLVQITVNNPDLRTFSCAACLRSITESPPGGLADNILKAASFILGKYQPIEQAQDAFVVLQDRIGDAGLSAKRMLLSSYACLAGRAKDPELTLMVAEVMIRESRSGNAEIQQRACEYLRLLQPGNESALQALLQDMPAFSEQASLPLFARLAPAASLPAQQAPRQQPIRTGSSISSTQFLTSNWEHGFRRMLDHSSAVLYQDALIQVGCRYSFESSPPRGHLNLLFTNVASYPLSSLSVQVTNPMGNSVLLLETKGTVNTYLAPSSTTQFEVIVEALQPFAVCPTLRVSFLAGSLSNITLKLPIILERFMSPVDLNIREFLARWTQLAPSQFQKKFRNWSVTKARAIVKDDDAKLRGLGWGIVKGTPAHVHLAAGILHTGSQSIACLMRLEPGSPEYTVAVRTTVPLVGAVLANNLSSAYQL